MSTTAARVSAELPPSLMAGKLLQFSQSGAGVKPSKDGEVCYLVSESPCVPGRRTSSAGGFQYLTSVATDPRTGDVYVADNVNQRVQKLDSEGHFILAFGWDVNQTLDRARSATQAERNVCAARSEDTCGAGTPGTAGGQFDFPGAVAVDPLTGDVYVMEITLGAIRVDKFTSEGSFVWTIGKGVNESNGGDICTEREIAQSHVKCGPGKEGVAGGASPYLFRTVSRAGDVLAVGGPGDLLYVGDEGRVQTFQADGKWVGDIAIPSPSPLIVTGLAVSEVGDLYVVGMDYKLGLVASVVREFDRAGKEVADIAVRQRQSYATVTIHGIAIDGSGEIAVIGGEEGLIEGNEAGVYFETYTLLGALYDSRTGDRVSEFDVPIGNDGIAFGVGGDLYVAATDGEEVLKYVRSPVVGLVSGLCRAGTEIESLITFNCAPIEVMQPIW